MTNDIYTRTRMLVGDEGVQRLKSAHVAVFGVGGVGSFAAEALVRAGIGKITIVDGEKFDETNLNRQLFALRSTIGMPKVVAAKERFLDINPDIEINACECFYTGDEVALNEFDYIADCIDTVTSKLRLIENAKSLDIPIISCMGAGNRLDCTCFEIKDIFETSGCPLARVMRRELRKRGIDKLNVVFSSEEAITPKLSEQYTDIKKVIGSISYVPSSAGLALAGQIIKDICFKA